MIKVLARSETEDVQVFLIDEERLRSIILSFRFFLQDRDCSFQEMNQVYDALDIHNQ